MVELGTILVGALEFGLAQIIRKRIGPLSKHPLIGVPMALFGFCLIMSFLMAAVAE